MAQITDVPRSLCTPENPILPFNVELPDGLEAPAREMIRQSPTFRAQCRRIAAAPNLHVVIRVDHFMQGHVCRAISVISRRANVIAARVTLARQPAYSEILAHEIEHILDQLEGLDLRALSRRRNTGVYQSFPDMFETTRAKEAGRRVAREVADREISRDPSRQTD